MDHMPVILPASDLYGLEWNMVEQHVYPSLQVGKKSIILLWGPAGSGKSTFAVKFADGVKGTAVCISSEEGIGPSLGARLHRANVKRRDFIIASRCSVDQIIKLTADRKATSLIIDSVSEAVWKPEELRHVLGLLPDLQVLLAIKQVNKAGEPLGQIAIVHEADVAIHLQDMKWTLTKSRFQDTRDVEGDVLPSPPPEPLQPIDAKDETP
jgi:hypothetical protein